MKNKIILATVLLIVGSGAAVASPSDSFSIDFGDDPFFDDTDSFGDDFMEEDESSEDESSSDGWFNDPFFSDEEDTDSDGRDSGNETEGCEEDEYHIPEDRDCDGEIDDEFQGDNPENDTEEQPPSDGAENESQVEERHVTPAPEPDYVGEDYLSYPNPRDHYKHDEGIHREGSIKVCHIMLNQNGEVIRGDTIDDMTLSVDTDIPYDDAESITFDTPVNQVADLVGTSDELVEGDGYLDAECAEYHDLRLNETYHYSQADLSGENADEVDVIGYQEFWSNQYEPLDAVEDYGTSSNSDGDINLSPGYNTRHAEVIVVTQITR